MVGNKILSFCLRELKDDHYLEVGSYCFAIPEEDVLEHGKGRFPGDNRLEELECLP
ncbi:unnamed protein product [marine sediment metagenome]|uniref:Uncharacterized protein n=1 Tax=marine sediment metagenome TaxID=412755 RepID=X1SEB2_9ZZZZ